MQVNNATDANVSISPLNRSQSVNRQESVREREIQQNQQAQPENTSPRVERISVDKNAIALLEKNTEQAKQTAYDTPARSNNTAVATYQSVGNLEQRESVQQLLGVDLYA